MKNYKTILAVVLITILVFSLGATVYARTWPDNVNDWSEEDWREFNNYYNAYNNRYQYQTPVWYNNHYIYWNGVNWYYIGEDGCTYYSDPPQNYYYGNCTPAPATNTSYTYSGYNYYNGVLNAYDANSEGQAQILAKIIYLYGHGVASQTQQACVGWAVMNSIDASSGGVDIGAIAPNFHYDASKPTTDDFGRDLMPLARDIIFRWKAGRAGIGNNGRVLPGGYCWVWSTGSTVVFRNTPSEGGAIWNYSLQTPYGS